MKICNDHNSQINSCTKRKYEVLSASTPRRIKERYILLKKCSPSTAIQQSYDIQPFDMSEAGAVPKSNTFCQNLPKEVAYINKLLLFGLVWFGLVYGISTFVGYLMPNPFYTFNSFISNNSV